MEATTSAVEAPTTTKSTAMEAASAHAASVSTATTSVTAATTSVTAATTTTTTTTTSECRSWLNQADRCQCEQGYNRFSHYAFPPLDERSLLGIQHFRSGIILVD